MLILFQVHQTIIAKLNGLAGSQSSVTQIDKPTKAIMFEIDAGRL